MNYCFLLLTTFPMSQTHSYMNKHCITEIYRSLSNPLGFVCALVSVTLARPPVSSSSQITNRSFRYASASLYLWNQLPFSLRQPHSIHSLLVHLILCISPHHSHHLRSHHLSLPRPFTPDLKLISFTNPFLHSRSYSFRTAFMDLNLY